MSIRTENTENGITHLVLNRPEASNALDTSFWSGFATQIRDLSDAGETRVLIVSAEGRNFCAGLDLNALASILPRTDTAQQREAFASLVKQMQEAISAVETARFPTIAVVQGACVGAGLDFLSAFDLCIATRSAFFAIEETNLGMMADIGSLQRLPKLMPQRLLRELAYTGRRMPAKEAMGLGLINQLCNEQSDALEAAQALATDIAAKSPVAIAGTKKALTFARDHSVPEALEWAALAQSAYWDIEAIMQAVQGKMTGQPVEFKDPAPVKRIR